MVELKGTLNGIGLPAVIQLLEELRESGRLAIWNASWTAELGFDQGQLVDASLGDERGLSALAAVTLTLADGDFAFTPGEAPLERTIELSPEAVRAQVSELTRLAERRLVEMGPGGAPQSAAVAAGMAAGRAEEGTAGVAAAPAGVACPNLGFADDPERHYPRPTALHRCYADGTAAVVSGPEQRELCLSGRFASCPRLRAAEQHGPAREQPGLSREQPGLVREQPAPAGRDLPRRAQPAPPPQSDLTAPVAGPTWPTRPSRLRFLTAVLLGVALVLAAVGAYRSVFVPPPSKQLAPVVVPTLSAPSSAPTPVAARSAPALAAISSPVVAAPPPTVAATPAAALAAGPPPLVDVRFTAGPQPGWVENPPFAGWSTGAYRMQAAESQHFVAVAAPGENLSHLADVLVTATFRKTGGPPGGGYGVIIRDQGPPPRDGENQDMNAYVLEVGDLGEYGIWRRAADQWVDLVPWTRDPRVHSGGSPNEMQVLAIGSHITLTVNSVQLAGVDDDTLPSGGVGVFTGGDQNDVALDRFVVQVPD